MLDWTTHPADTRLNWEKHAHAYQKAGAGHLFQNRAATLWLDPGYGKTMIVLHAFKALLSMGLAKNMLVIAPKRVMQTVWPQEIEHWASLDGLRAVRLHGAKKEKWLKRTDANVWVINYEGLPWLAKMAKEGRLPFKFDVVVFDEIRRMKNNSGVRFKAVKPIAAMAGWVWGATGTPSANGLLDLFGQFLILDGGKALGTRITKFRHDYFELGFDGFTWTPRPGAREAIEQKIAPMVYRVTGQIDLPEIVLHPIHIPLEKAVKAKYNDMKRDLVAQVSDGTTLTAANAAVLWGKLKQIANGRVYDADRAVIHIHDAKQEALAELRDELGDEQLLIAYEYNHDLEQIRKVLGDDIPYLGAGVSESRAIEIVDQWNAGTIRDMAAHPASAGHGLNLQKSGAHHILWFGPTVDLDHYIQFIRRLLRQGNVATSVVVHTFLAEGTVDEHADEARESKDSLQGALLRALTAEIGDRNVVNEQPQENQPMNTPLQFRADAQQQAPAPQGNPFAMGNTAPPAGSSNPFAQGQAPQQEQVQQQQAPQAATQPANNPFAGGFGGQTPAVQQQTIQQDVAAMPPRNPQQAVDAQVEYVPPPQQANPFAQGQAPQPNISTTPEDRQPPASDTGWQDPKSGRNQANDAGVAASIGDEKPSIDVPNTAPAGMVPFYTMVPADKLDKVLSAIARAVKP